MPSSCLRPRPASLTSTVFFSPRQTKTVDKNTSVLQYLVKLVRDNSPDLLCVHGDMASVGPAQYVVVDTLASELRDMTARLARVQGTAATEGQRNRGHRKREKGTARAVTTVLDPLKGPLPGRNTNTTAAEGGDTYSHHGHVDLTEMETFFMRATEHLEAAHVRLNEAKNSFREILRYVGQDPTMTSAEFFGALNQFLITFDAALEVELAAEKEARAARPNIFRRYSVI